jgi:hypothetical protein
MQQVESAQISVQSERQPVEKGKDEQEGLGGDTWSTSAWFQTKFGSASN